MPAPIPVPPVLPPVNNSLLRNAALSGFLAGVYVESSGLGTTGSVTDPDIADLAATFADQVDQAIGADSAITNGSTSQANLPTAPATLEAQLGKCQILSAVSAAKVQAYAIAGLVGGAIPTDILDALVADVYAAYAAAVAQLYTP